MAAKMADVREVTMRDMIQKLTGGRPYMFMIVSYKPEKQKLYETVYNTVCRISEKHNIGCIRADQLPGSGHDLLAKIHHLINRAEVVVAEISECSPNVFYEIGYAVGVQKLPLLLIAKGKKVPTDLQGLEVVQYRNTIDGIVDLKKDFAAHLRFHLNSDLAVLRDMLEAPSPYPSYIVSSPKYPGPRQARIRANIYDQRTFGDHLGILGLISAFGSMWGEGKGVELISGQHSPPDLLDRDINLYIIGSRKSTPPTAFALEMLLGKHQPQWSVDPPGNQTAEGDWETALYRLEGEKRKPVEGVSETLHNDEVWITDYGVVVRAPHPKHHGRLALVMFGAHSLGTGAACLAATRCSLIQKIRSKLPPGTIESKDSAFWVLVKGTVNRSDFLLDEDGVTIEEAGVYD